MTSLQKLGIALFGAVYLCLGVLHASIVDCSYPHKIDDAIDGAKEEALNIINTPLEEDECLYVDPNKKITLVFNKQTNSSARKIFLWLPDALSRHKWIQREPLGEINCIGRGSAHLIDDTHERTTNEVIILLTDQFRTISNNATVAQLRKEKAKGRIDLSPKPL